MRITITIELPDDAVKAYDWYTDAKSPDPRMPVSDRLANDLEREAKFRAEQYIRNIVTIYQTRPRNENAG